MREEGDHVVFLHRLAPGPADRSYGINVAQMAGMPSVVVARAKEILARLEEEQIDVDHIHSATSNGHRAGEPESAGVNGAVRAEELQREVPLANDEASAEADVLTTAADGEKKTVASSQLDLFPQAVAPFANELKRMNLSQVTPLQALLKLNEWQENLRRED